MPHIPIQAGEIIVSQIPVFAFAHLLTQTKVKRHFPDQLTDPFDASKNKANQLCSPDKASQKAQDGNSNFHPKFDFSTPKTMSTLRDGTLSASDLPGEPENTLRRSTTAVSGGHQAIKFGTQRNPFKADNILETRCSYIATKSFGGV